MDSESFVDVASYTGGRYRSSMSYKRLWVSSCTSRPGKMELIGLILHIDFLWYPGSTSSTSCDNVRSNCPKSIFNSSMLKYAVCPKVRYGRCTAVFTRC